MIKILIFSMCGVWILQTILGYFQMKHFTKEFSILRRKGKVAIGKDKGKIKAGTVIMICIDENKNILEAKVMSGLTVFAKLKTIKELENQNFLNIDKDVINKFNKMTVKAIDNAIENYYAFKEVRNQAQES